MHGGRKGSQKTSLETWKTGDDGREVRVWLELMEGRRPDFEKANLQAYIDLADEAMEETVHGGEW